MTNGTENQVEKTEAEKEAEAKAAAENSTNAGEQKAEDTATGGTAA